MHKIAKGMEYLHKYEVLHGDLKVCVSCTMNVLHVSQPEDTVPLSNVQMPQMVFYTSGVGDPVVQVLDMASDTISISLLEVQSFFKSRL
jgi:hypothetical protein